MNIKILTTNNLMPSGNVYTENNVSDDCKNPYLWMFINLTLVKEDL